MIKRKNQVTVVNVERDGETYKVVLRSLKNTETGNPRYEAIILFENDFNAVYTFQGHYSGDKGEAEYIVDYMLSDK